MTSGENKKKVSDTSTSTEYTIVKIRESPELDENDNPESVEKDTLEVESAVNEGETNPNSLILQVGICVLVAYDAEHFPGEINNFVNLM